ncbi:MAG: Ldh family oxidoreductase [Geminicoccaceae bacterium]|nr:Ldh family oxidoreductase [Geminicoccaceae bacterium]
MEGGTRLSIRAIEDLARKALEAAGTDPDNAAPLARAVAQAERDGIPSHGLAYVPVYCEHVRCGKVDGRAEPTVGRPRPGLVRVDAATGFAHPAIDLGFKVLIPLARAQGVAMLGVVNSYNCGVLGHHVERLAEAGLVGLGFTNAPASIAPVGGARPVLGTNPFALALPDGAGSWRLLVDQSASVVAKSEAMARARSGEPVPEGWVLGTDGHPVTAPEAVLRGTMAPAGGPKGVGQALLVETMAALLTGATLGLHASPFSGTEGGPPRTGQGFVAFDPEAMAGAGFFAGLRDLAGAIEGQQGARLPGARRKAARARADAEGVLVPDRLLDRLKP